MFFHPEIGGFPGTLSDVRGEGLFHGYLLLLLLGTAFLPGTLTGHPDISDDADVKASTVSPDSIRYVYPPYVVEGGRWNKRELESDLLLTVIGSDRLNSTAMVSMGDVLDHSAGIILRRTGGPGSSSFLSIRGSTAQQVLVLLNGRRLNTAQGGGVDLSSLSPQDISRIEIYREHNSAKYSSESIGGVINIVTDERKGEQLRMKTAGGSYGVRSFSAGAGVGDEVRLHVGANYRAGEDDFDFEDPRRGGEIRRANADYRDVSYSGTLDAPLGGDRRFLLYLARDEDRRGAPGPIEFPTPEARLFDDRLVLQGDLSDKRGSLDMALGAGMHRSRRDYRNPDPVLWADDRHVNTSLSAHFDGDWELSDRHEIEMGGHYARDMLSSTTDGNQQKETIASYLIWTAGLTERDEGGGPTISVTPSVRFERTGGYGTRVLPFLSSRVSVLSDRLILRGSIGRKYRTPSFDELFWPLSSGAEGNPDLKPEMSTASELSASLFLLGRRMRMRGTCFRRNLTDLIEWTPGAAGIWRPHNIGRAREEGIEIEGSFSGTVFRWFPPLSVEVTHTFLRATDEGEDPLTAGKQLVRRPQTISSGLIEGHPSGHLTLGMRWSRVGRRFLTNTNSKWMNGYNVIDCHMKFSVHEAMDGILSVRNLADRSYYDIEEFPVPGRSFIVEVDLKI